MTTDRAQSNVVGVAVLLGITVIALGALTASIGAVVESNAATADAHRVADGFDRALEPVETTGYSRGRVSASSGRFYTADRELRILDGSGVVATVSVDALVYESEGREVRAIGGARMYRPPPITASRQATGVLVVGAPRLNASSVAVGGDGSTDLVLRSNVTHERRSLGNGTYRIAVETETPHAWQSYFERLNATVVATDRDVDGDGVTSVVARFPGDRTAYLVVHDMRLEVDRG